MRASETKPAAAISRIGKGLAAFFGAKMLVLSFTPCIGITVLLRSKAGPASCRASDRNARAKMNVDSSDSRHRVSVHELPVAERVFAKCAFDLESEFAIQRDRGLIVRENGQLDSREVQPFIGEINHRLHHRRADAFAMLVIAHHHPDLGLMRDSRPRRRMQADRADDFAINDSDQDVLAFSTFGQKFAN